MSDVAQRRHSARQIWAAPGSSHDRTVNILSVVLPMAIGVLAAFLVLAPLMRTGDASFLLAKNNVAIAKQRLKIEQAHYRGQDSKGRPFQLTAGSAIQKSSAEPVVRLTDLAAQMDLSDGPAKIVAGQGRYNMRDEQVALDGPVTFHDSDGYQLDTSDATIDLKNRTMQSAGAVKGTVPQGTFSADRMSANLETHSVTLDGNARLRFVPGKTK
jgi:lipopolysaccharide export system protein LptC